MKTLRKFASVFACFALPLTAQATSVTGNAFTGHENLDNHVTSFMQDVNATAASVSIVKDGKLVATRGYGIAEAETGLPTHPYSRFRIASTSKFITAVAINKLADEGLLAMDDKVFGPNGILKNLQPFPGPSIIDSRYEDIEVEQLLYHSSGLHPNQPGDPMRETTVEDAMGLGRPSECSEVTQYALGSVNLSWTPGTDWGYSNFGFCVASLVVEAVVGMDYFDYVNSEIFSTIGVTTASMGRTLIEHRQPDEWDYKGTDGDFLATNIFDEDGPDVLRQYGGYHVERGLGAGAWIMAGPDYLRFLNHADLKGVSQEIFSIEQQQSMLKYYPVTTYGSCNEPVNGFGCSWYAQGFGRRNTNEGFIEHNGAMTDATNTHFKAFDDGMTYYVAVNTWDQNNYIENLTSTLVTAHNNSEWTLPNTDLFTPEANNTPPSLTVNAPVVNGDCVEISGTVNDNRWVNKVEVRLGIYDWQYAEVNVNEFTFSSCNSGSGSFTVHVKATDDQGLSTSVKGEDALIGLTPSCIEHTATVQGHIDANRAYSCGLFSGCVRGSDENIGYTFSVTPVTLLEVGFAQYEVGSCQSSTVNLPPVLTVTEPSINDDCVSVTVSATDDTSAVILSAGIDGAISQQITSGNQFSQCGLSVGSHVVSIYARDQEDTKTYFSSVEFEIESTEPDTVAPSLTLIGDNPAHAEQGESYNDAGANAQDDRDGNISGNVVVTGTVNTQVAGSYTLYYDVSDAAGNPANQISREVIVSDTRAPVVTLNGQANVTLTVGNSFTDPGATALDTVDGNFSTNDIDVTGSVNTNAVGTYTLHYTATDLAGNTSTVVTRTVIVEEEQTSNCQEHTSTVANHISAGRAYACGLWNLYGCAVGSDTQIGSASAWSTTQVTLAEEPEGFFTLGSCQ